MILLSVKNVIKFIIVFFILFIFLEIYVSTAITNKKVITTAKNGNGVLDLLRNHKLSTTMQNIEYFQKLNAGEFDKNGGLLLDKRYILPISIVKFNGVNIRSTLGLKNYKLAKKIENYNLEVENKKIKNGHYRKTKELWVPYEFYIVDSASIKEIKKSKNIPTSNIDYSYLLEYEKSAITNRKLSGFAFYLISGHGGPDVGAIGNRAGNELHEDEYAYDVTIRLAKKMRESGADVYMIVQDAKDGIRNDKYLKNNYNEKLIDGDTISSIQIERLKQRTDIINNYSTKNKKKYKQQLLIEIHVDSRTEDKRVDIFFYHREGSIKSEQLNKTLLTTIEKAYEKVQPNRGYNGTARTRDLFTLRNTTIDATFIELGNIQNPADQLRLIQYDNRQAIANWLYQGILKHYRK